MDDTDDLFGDLASKIGKKPNKAKMNNEIALLEIERLLKLEPSETIAEKKYILKHRDFFPCFFLSKQETENLIAELFPSSIHRFYNLIDFSLISVYRNEALAKNQFVFNSPEDFINSPKFKELISQYIEESINWIKSDLKSA